MTPIECAREQDVLDAVAAGRWPDRCERDLRAHVERCAICAEVAAVAHALREDYERAWQQSQVPPSGRVWWRAEMRARHEAARRAAQPITVVQGLVGACVVGLALALLQWTWLRFAPSLAPAEGLGATGSSGAAGFLGQMLGAGWNAIVTFSVAAPQIVWPIGFAVGAVAIVTPLALYLVFSEK